MKKLVISLASLTVGVVVSRLLFEHADHGGRGWLFLGVVILMIAFTVLSLWRPKRR